MNAELKQELFDLCSSKAPRYTYLEAFVKIDENESHGSFHITQVDWVLIKLGSIAYEDAKNDLLEHHPTNVEKSGWYNLKGLFNLEYDSDDYRSWSYLTEPEIIEYEFQIGIEEMEKQQEEWNKFDFDNLPF